MRSITVGRQSKNSRCCTKRPVCFHFPVACGERHKNSQKVITHPACRKKQFDTILPHLVAIVARLGIFSCSCMCSLPSIIRLLQLTSIILLSCMLLLYFFFLGPLSTNHFNYICRRYVHIKFIISKL